MKVVAKKKKKLTLHKEGFKKNLIQHPNARVVEEKGENKLLTFLLMIFINIFLKNPRLVTIL